MILVKDVFVDFPHSKPYHVQKVYMEKLIECLENRSDGVLESPTGTGKTLALLCASLAWAQREKTKVNISSNFSETESTDLNPPVAVPKIVYASRTHSQLTQAIQELKATNYNHMKVAVLGSRDQLCINEELMNENSRIKDRKCISKIKAITTDLNGQQRCGCSFYDGYSQAGILDEVSDKIMDIEDLVTEGKKKLFCPYYMARDLAKHADIIFMPYNYLVDPKIRSSLKDIGLDRSIIILDEAHNIPQVCEDAASIEFKSSDILAAIEDIQFLINLDHSSGLDFLAEKPKFNAHALKCLEGFLVRFKNSIEEIDINNRQCAKEFGGEFIYTLMEKADIACHTARATVMLISEVITVLKAHAEKFGTEVRGSELKTFQNIVRTSFLSGKNCCEDVKKHFRVYIELVKLPLIQTLIHNKLIHFWCFSPKFCLEYLHNVLHVHCIIFTSGTMTPLQSFIKCLGIPIGVTVQNGHIIDDSQIHVRIISSGSDKEKLMSNYENRNNPKYINSLGSTILSLCPVIPHGVLIFFTSYIVLNMCKDNWQESGIWNQINQSKTIFIEPQSKENFLDTMNGYYAKISDPFTKGAIFMAVCRGKVAEGLDFANDNGRAVIVTGLPFSPVKDPKVKLKKCYMNDCYADDNKSLDGEQWYCLEASRAVNQAIGRVIRHKHDYGAILLLDCRFDNPRQKSQLPIWLQGRFQNSSTKFGEVITSISKFFRTQNSVPTPSPRGTMIEDKTVR